MSPLPERAIFLQALEEESPEARRAFLEQACAGNEQLRASVEALLRAHHLPDNPLDEPVAEMRDSDLSISDPSQPQPRIEERPGTVIGPYKLREQIGEGGFGLVFVAEQQRPVQRRVALKVVKPGMDTRDVIARFEAERQALALMDHQNIARVFDAGTTDTGRPYFVMELVRGVPVTEFCDQHELDARQRLELFITVCSAVQHAHQKGVIHRDIKPSNVLITLHDETPVVKVIDFGVAKAIGQSLTDKTIYTRFTAMIGTPLYMSPEQAEMSGLDVDTRSDIYSLGVVLYELLTGTTPFDRERLNVAGVDEVRRIIREEDPPKPSTRLTTLGNSASTMRSRRGTTPSRSLMAIPGDLDWIVMKAIEKDRQRRYESAGSLAADLRRFLNEEPVEARPPSRLYKMRIFARRNKGTIVTVSLVAAALLLGTAVSVWQTILAISERNEKQVALDDAIAARNDANLARKQIEVFTRRLKEANILVTSGRAHAYAERWSVAYADYTRAIELQPNYYSAWIERAALEVRLGLWKRAAEDYSKALDLGIPANNPASWGIPQLFLFNGDQASHREYCLGMLRQEPDDSRTSIAVIRSCVISAEPVADPAELARQAEASLEATWNHSPGPGDPRGMWTPDDRNPRGHQPPSNELFDGRPWPKPEPGAPHMGPPRPPDEPGRPFEGQSPFPPGLHYYVVGLAEYRAGDFEKAVSRFKQALDEPNWQGRAIIYPALAMAHHRSGHAEEARHAFDSSKEAMDAWTEEMLQSPVGRIPMPWFDWIEVRLLYREAAMVLTRFAPADDPRLRVIQERALTAIQEGQPMASP